MKKIMKIFIIGAINYDEDNWERKFYKAQDYLVSQYPDAYIVNPAELSIDVNGAIAPKIPDWQDYLLYYLSKLSHCTHIYLLTDWGSSDGSRIAKLFAGRLGIKMI